MTLHHRRARRKGAGSKKLLVRPQGKSTGRGTAGYLSGCMESNSSTRSVSATSWENAMKIFNSVVIAGALLSVPISTAAAGPCTAETENITKLVAARDAGAGPTTGAGGAAGAQPAEPRAQHPPTAIIGQQTQGGATSPQDVQSQSRGGATAADQAQGASRPAAEALASAQAALEEARSLDRAGKESECMDAIGRAKRFLG